MRRYTRRIRVTSNRKSRTIMSKKGIVGGRKTKVSIISDRKKPFVSVRWRG